MSGSIHIRAGKRGTSIRAKGEAAQRLFEAMASSVGEPVELVAYCWATGEIGFGSSVPDGAIEIARGDAVKVRNLVEVTARHGWRQGPKGQRTTVFLVAGVPESADQQSAGDALGAYLLWIKDRESEGLTIKLGEGTSFNPFYAGVGIDGQSCFTLTADDRIRSVATFNRYQCRAALKVPLLQATVRAAVERRLRKLEHAS